MLGNTRSDAIGCGEMRRIVSFVLVGLIVVSGLWVLSVPLGSAFVMPPQWSYSASGTVYSVAISEDGNYIVAGTGNGYAYLFSKTSSTPLWSFLAGDEIHSVAISGDGTYIAVGSWDGVLYAFEKTSSTPLWSSSLGGSVLSVDISSNGQYIVAGSSNSLLQVHFTGSAIPIWGVSLTFPVRSVAISDNSNFLVAGSGPLVNLYHPLSSTPVWSGFTGFGINWVDISSNGSYIVATDDGNLVHLFNMGSSIPLWTYSGSDTIWMVSVAGTGEYVAAASSDMYIHVFHRSSNVPLWSHPTGNWADAVDISDDGNYLAGGSANGKAFFYSPTSSPIWEGQGGGVVRTCSVTSHGEYVAVGGGSTVKLFPGDIFPPLISGVDARPQPQIAPGYVNISANVSDDSPETTAFADVTLPDLTHLNFSMSPSPGNRFYSNETYDQVGVHDFTVWASDPAGNWNSSSGSFTLMSPAPPSAPPTDIQAHISGPVLGDVRVTWTLSADDGAGNDDVVAYNIYRSGSFNGSGSGYALHDSVPGGSAEYVDTGAGEGDPDSYFYRICSVNTGSALGCAATQAGKYTRDLSPGPQLVSIPLVPSDAGPGTVFQTVAFDSIRTYDSANKDWGTHMAYKSYGGDLRSIDASAGYWVNVLADCSLTVAGIVPLETQISLQKGWNLVGFPSFKPSTVSDLKAQIGITRAEGTDPVAIPHHLRVLGDADTLLAGCGYWMKVDAPTQWVVWNI